MRIAIIDESAVRASVMQEGLTQLGECEIFVITERRGLMRRVSEIDPDIVLMDLGNPSRDVLEEYFAVSRALARPIAMFVDDPTKSPSAPASMPGCRPMSWTALRRTVFAPSSTLPFGASTPSRACKQS
jgi:AmiR/NasT family two-component response regulator